LYAGPERISLTCHAGCHSDDVLAAVGLSWKDTLYRDSSLSPEERKEWARRKFLDELHQRQERVKGLKLWLESLVRNERMGRPVRVKNQFERDIEALGRML
jgi:hypothetical protein